MIDEYLAVAVLGGAWPAGLPDEDLALEAEEDTLADAVAHREAAEAAYEAMAGDGGGVDAVGRAMEAIAGHRPSLPKANGTIPFSCMLAAKLINSSMVVGGVHSFSANKLGR